jgi:dihydrolipoamide dehydrogenase
MNETYDLAIIGSGPAGYSASLRASDLGLKACIIEKELTGGTCLNWGCIPTKAIARSADLISEIRQAAVFGIDIESYSHDIARILERKDQVVLKLRKGAESLLKIKGVGLYQSSARLISPNAIETTDGIINAKHILIATGSMPLETDSLRIDYSRVLSSRDMLDAKVLPENLIIIGGGFIGCEFASIYNRLGIKVTLIEAMEQILPGFDKEISRNLELVFKKDGINVFKNTKVLSIEKGFQCSVKLSDNTILQAEKIFLCIGRKPNIAALNLESAGIDTEKGAVVVNEYLQTNIPNIYSAGDANGRYLLAHVASYQGALVADNIAGSKRKADYSAVPNVMFTDPEIASVGISIEQAKQSNINARQLKLPFAAVSKAHILGQTNGFIKIVVDAETKKILGACLLGPLASELVSSFTIAIRHGLTVRDISDTIFAHPTLSESFLAAADKDINYEV